MSVSIAALICSSYISNICNADIDALIRSASSILKSAFTLKFTVFFYLTVLLFFFLFFIQSSNFYNIIYPTVSKENLPLHSLLGFHTHQIKKISVLPMFHSFLYQHRRLVSELLQFLALPKLFLALLLLKFILCSKTKLNPSFLYLCYIQRLCL